MKLLVSYSSKTGNTAFFCKEVCKRIEDRFEIDLVDMKELDQRTYVNYDVVVVGFWVNKATANKEAMKFIESIRNKKVALLGTLGASPEGEHADKVRRNVKDLVDASNTYLGVKLARGKVDEKIAKTIRLIPFVSKELKQQMYESSMQSREPSEQEIAEAAEFLLASLA